MSTIIQSLLITLALGAFLGLQLRKIAEEGHFREHVFAGMRTCMAITLLGFLSVLLSQFNEHIFILFSSFFLLLVLLSYAQSAFMKGRVGGTTETILACLFLVGVLVGFRDTNLAIILTIILSVIASGHEQIYKLSSKFTKFEIIEMIKFSIIIFLILPLLPNHTIDPLDVINPYTVWLMVILISGIGFVGYMASKFIGKKGGILLSGFVGGLVSSLGVTISMAMENKKKPKLINLYAMAILFASCTMYGRVLVETLIINPELMRQLIVPIGAMLMTMLSYTLYSYWKTNHSKRTKKSEIIENDIKLESPLSITPALKFSVFFVAILLLIKISELYIGNKGIYITTLIASLADIDAIAISLSQLSSSAEITNTLAVRAITYGVITNTLIKILYVHMFSNKELTLRMLKVFAFTSAVGIAASFTI